MSEKKAVRWDDLAARSELLRRITVRYSEDEAGELRFDSSIYPRIQVARKIEIDRWCAEQEKVDEIVFADMVAAVEAELTQGVQRPEIPAVKMPGRDGAFVWLYRPNVALLVSESQRRAMRTTAIDSQTAIVWGRTWSMVTVSCDMPMPLFVNLDAALVINPKGEMYIHRDEFGDVSAVYRLFADGGIKYAAWLKVERDAD